MVLYRHLLIIACMGILFSGYATYLNVTTRVDPAPLHWIMLITFLALPIIWTREARERWLKSPIAAWSLFFVGMGMLGWFPASNKDLALQDLRWRLLTVGELGVYMCLFAGSSAVVMARRAVAAAVIVGAGFNLYEMIDPDVGFSSVPGRAAGLYMNPNASGIVLVLGMILSVTSLPGRWRVPFILLTAVAVVSTISRSSIIALLVAAGGFLATGKVNARSLLAWLAIALALAAALILPRLDAVLNSMEREGVINKNLLERLEWFSDPTGVSDFSSWERKYMARRAWEEVELAPLIGNGTGSSWRPLVGAHNQYLTMMQDHGLLGAGILPLLVLAVTWRTRGETRSIAILYGLAVLLLGFFSHNILYQEFYLISFALMASMTHLSRIQGSEDAAEDVPIREGAASSFQFG